MGHYWQDPALLTAKDLGRSLGRFDFPKFSLIPGVSIILFCIDLWEISNLRNKNCLDA